MCSEGRLVETICTSPLFQITDFLKVLFYLNLATLQPTQEMLQLQQHVPCVHRIVPRSTLNVLMT